MKQAMNGLTGEDCVAFAAFCAFAVTTLLWGGHLSALWS